MTSIYQTNTVTLQLPFPAFLNAWRRRMHLWSETRQAKRIARKRLSMLQSLPQQTLDDLGIDVQTKRAAPPRVVCSNPYVVAFCELANVSTFHIQDNCQR